MAEGSEKAQSFKRAAKLHTKTQWLRTEFSTPLIQGKQSPKVKAEKRRETILRKSKYTKYSITRRTVTTSAFKNNRLHLLLVKGEKDRASSQYARRKPRNGNSHQSIWKMSWWCRKTIFIWLTIEKKQIWRVWALASSATTWASESQDLRKNWSRRKRRLLWPRRPSLVSSIARTTACLISTQGLQPIPIIKRTFAERRNHKLTQAKSPIGWKICTSQRCWASPISKMLQARNRLICSTVTILIQIKDHYLQLVLEQPQSLKMRIWNAMLSEVQIENSKNFQRKKTKYIYRLLNWEANKPLLEAHLANCQKSSQPQAWTWINNIAQNIQLPLINNSQEVTADSTNISHPTTCTRALAHMQSRTEDKMKMLKIS